MSGPDLLADLSESLLKRRPATGPLIVGLTGAVSAGKSTFAGQLSAALASRALQVETLNTDGFLWPNADLAARGLLDQKGFPPSYDLEGLHTSLRAIRTGPVRIPTYSHVIYDIDPALTRTLAPPDILLVEGLSLHHRARPGPGADPLDLLIYLDAEEADLEAWYVHRFMGLWEAAEHDPTSFYARFRAMSRTDTEALARQVWTQVNLRNLREHILQARDHADFIVTKGKDHALMRLESRQA